ncbi:MAG: hypothetical protein FJW35_13855 [Acidobacteria bacterium]|nr:hypothetical protein [Acidobacteriota bacterium]
MGVTINVNRLTQNAMPFLEFIWDLEDDPNGNVQHIAEHGLSREDVEQVLCNPAKSGVSRTSGRRMAFGYTEWGGYIAVVYEQVDQNTVYPVTAFELEEE